MKDLEEKELELEVSSAIRLGDEGFNEELVYPRMYNADTNIPVRAPATLNPSAMQNGAPRTQQDHQLLSRC
jgi:hypothetical protein